MATSQNASGAFAGVIGIVIMATVLIGAKINDNRAEYRYRIEAIDLPKDGDQTIVLAENHTVTIRNPEPFFLSHWGHRIYFEYGDRCALEPGDRLVPINTNNGMTLLEVEELLLTREEADDITGGAYQGDGTCPSGTFILLPTDTVQEMRAHHHQRITHEQKKRWYVERAGVKNLLQKSSNPVVD